MVIVSPQDRCGTPSKWLFYGVIIQLLATSSPSGRSLAHVVYQNQVASSACRWTRKLGCAAFRPRRFPLPQRATEAPATHGNDDDDDDDDDGDDDDDDDHDHHDDHHDDVDDIVDAN